MGDRWFTRLYVGIGVGEAAFISVGVPQLKEVPSFDMRMSYEDVAKKLWKTSAPCRNSDRVLGPNGGYKPARIDRP